MMRHWTLDDIEWERFDRSKLDPEIVKVVKAASLVEYNGHDYAAYLSSVFHDDPEFQAAAEGWGAEEVQHGEALARWAVLADPSFDFAASFDRFSAVIMLPLEATRSIRGSRCGELISRCLVEVGTSSYYSALGQATEEPVLKQICRNIAGDELRHYKLFYSHMKRYLAEEQLGFWRRLWVGIGRMHESEDDELAYAYYAANHAAEGPYERKRFRRAYARRAYGVYRFGHVEYGLAMIFKAIGLRPHGRLNRWLARLLYAFIQHRATRLARAGV